MLRSLVYMCLWCRHVKQTRVSCYAVASPATRLCLSALMCVRPFATKGVALPQVQRAVRKK